MASYINTNISSLNSQRALSSSQNTLQTSLQRLSTGLRINSAKDDSAGLAISTRMTAQINGMNQASRNANDAISMSQTAEGAMGSINDILLRMRDLSVQAANGSNGDKERGSIQNEVDQLYAEIDRISQTTNFNGVKLLDGSAKNTSFQVGASANQTISFSINEVSTKAMSLNSGSALGDLNSGRIGAAPADGSDELKINGAGVTMETTDTTAKLQAAKINAISGQTGVSATAYNSVQGTVGASGAVADGALSINGVAINASANMSELVDNINKQVGGLTASIGSNGQLSLTNDDGADIVIQGSGGGLSGAAAPGTTYKGYISLKSGDGSDIELSGDALGKFGFNKSTGAGNLDGAALTNGQAGAALTAADGVKINGVAVGASATGSAVDKAAAINAVRDKTGVTASATTTAIVDLDLTATVANPTTDVTINGTAIDLTNVNDIAGVMDAINGTVAGVTASTDELGQLVLTSSSGSDIAIEDDTGFLGGDSLTHGTISLKSDTGTAIRLEEKAGGSGLANMGLTAQGGDDATIGGKLSVSTQANAQSAIKRIDEAIDFIADQRATMGAVQNRFTSTIANLQTSVENASASRSRIQDADFAAETANMTRAQILQQAGTAMLAQANSLPNNVLSLLRG